MRRFGNRFALMGVTVGLLMTTVTPARAVDLGIVNAEVTPSAVISLEVSGRGSTPLTPLSYTGSSGEIVTDNTGLYVMNTGDEAITALYLAWGSDPTVGADVWTLGDTQGPGSAVWALSIPFSGSWVTVPASGEPTRYLYGTLARGRRIRFDSRFGFPTDYSDRNAHVMTALITVEP